MALRLDDAEVIMSGDENEEIEVDVGDISDITGEDFSRQYDLTPLNGSPRGSDANKRAPRAPSTPSYSIDPWEVSASNTPGKKKNPEVFFSTVTSPR